MEQRTDFQLPVAAAPAYLTATVAAVSAIGALVVITLVGHLMLSVGRFSGEPVDLVSFFFPVLALGLLAAAAVMALLARSEFRLLRNPPVFTSEGVRLRVFARSGYDVFVPWGRVSRMRVAEMGSRPYLMMHVPEADDLVGGDPDKAERLRRTERRYEGAAFVYALRGALIHAEDLGAVVHRLSGGSVGLDL